MQTPDTAKFAACDASGSGAISGIRAHQPVGRGAVVIAVHVSGIRRWRAQRPWLDHAEVVGEFAAGEAAGAGLWVLWQHLGVPSHPRRVQTPKDLRMALLE